MHKTSRTGCFVVVTNRTAWPLSFLECATRWLFSGVVREVKQRVFNGVRAVGTVSQPGDKKYELVL